ncbi:MAG: 30S ribosomal protein S12 methylthiotransferase RimO [Sphaerochaetaceae bacterium]
MEKKKLYIENLGCAKNQVDAEVMLHRLEQEGFVKVEDALEADLIMVNSCGFIEPARQESIESFFELKAANPNAKIIFSGCMAQRYAKSLEEQLHEADGIFGNRDLTKITSFVNRLYKEDRVVETPPYPLIEDADKRENLFNFPGSAYLKISEGCNHRCRYCAIPLIRGSLRSRSKEIIVAEAKELIANGIKEINLIAQDLAAYGTDKNNQSQFLDLLETLVSIEGDFKIRMLYIHPDYFPDELINFVVNNEKVIPYFDLPFQHADPFVLKMMGRTGDSETYLNLIKRIRAAIPDATIRSTFMLGFTNETEESFKTLLNFVKEAQLDWAGSFIYSKEENTPAYKDSDNTLYKKQIKEAAKWQKELEKTQQEITQKRLKRFVGTEQYVLIEELIEDEDLAIGRTVHQAPEVDGLTVVMGHNLKEGSVIRCGIRRLNGIDLEALPIKEVLI